MARLYLDLAEGASGLAGDEGRSVAAGNAVLAAIAAADALCCLRLGTHNRAQAHQAAAALLHTVTPHGARLARDLTTVLSVKDAAHYGTVFLSASTLKTTLRATTHLVEAAEDALTTT